MKKVIFCALYTNCSTESLRMNVEKMEDEAIGSLNLGQIDSKFMIQE